MGKTKNSWTVRRRVGRVARWNVHRTFGFIVEEENLKESFMHLDDVVGGEAPKIGDSVEFTKQISKFHDCDRARNVRILKQDDGAVQRGVCKFFDGVEGFILASSGRRIPVHALDCLNSVVPKRGTTAMGPSAGPKEILSTNHGDYSRMETCGKLCGKPSLSEGGIKPLLHG